MIYEYALEPEMAATWGSRENYRFFLSKFGLGRGRVVSCYPETWPKIVWRAYHGDNEMDKKRLEELLVRFQEIMIKRKNCCWDDTRNGWLENALVEHGRHSFRAILVRNKPGRRPEIIDEADLAASPCAGWDTPHGLTVKRNAADMLAAVKMMLTRCRWVKFIDPHISPGRPDYRRSLRAFLGLLGNERPLGPLEGIEIHTRQHAGTPDFLQDSYEEIIPVGLQVTLYQWQEKSGGQKLHNRYILTDLGGVGFQHGLDTGARGETDDINRLDREQYILRCSQYNGAASAFDQAAPPLNITGKPEE